MISSIAAVRDRFSSFTPELWHDEVKTRASVSLILREEEGGLSLFFIRRAESEADHWSGHIAFPGGRVDPGDPGPRETAERETLEEVGLALEPDDYIGRLGDLRGQTQSIIVSAFVYGVTRPAPLVLNHEVADGFWLPLREIVQPDRHVERGFDYLGQTLYLPAIRVMDGEGPVLWGLSYRFLEILLTLVDHEIPSMPWRADL
jgi:8-oxo-dGTP pyrophosphatase MutT (NUDIX family)